MLRKDDRVQIHCPSLRKYPRFAAGFHGKTGIIEKLFDPGYSHCLKETLAPYAKVELAGGSINIELSWLRRAS